MDHPNAGALILIVIPVLVVLAVRWAGRDAKGR
jgi:hypothetical protein